MPDASAATTSMHVDGPLLFRQKWGETGFLGDYFGLVASGRGLDVAYPVASGDDVHVAFKQLSAY